jgi:AcrR family transcriptional regulator
VHAVSSHDDRRRVSALTDTAATRAEKRVQERTAILKAAFGLIGRSRDEPVSVQQILDAAGLSTRAFYRHFRSKDELILTMCRTAGDRVAAETAGVLAAAASPANAIEAWIRHQLSVVYDPRRARQTSVLTSWEARSAAGMDHVVQEASAARRDTLAAVIRRGRDDGSFPLVTDPDEDARAIASVVSGVIAARLAGEQTPSWDAATRHTTRLFLRAFGCSPD